MRLSLSYKLRMLRRMFANLPRRALLTLRHHGVRETLRRIVTFPLRLTPFGGRLPGRDPTIAARSWYRKEGRPVAVVIPTYGSPDLVHAAVRSVRRTTNRKLVRIIVADDGSPPKDVEQLRRIDGVELIEGGDQRGFAANCNRGLLLVRPDEDAVLLNSDVVARPGWLEALQHTAYGREGSRVGVVGAKLLYPGETIQFGGTIRNPGAPEWFDHRFRFKPADYPPANVRQPVLAVTGACMYVTRATLDDVGLLDEAYGMAYEDVDYCLRVWESGRRVFYAPAAELTHHESKTRGMQQGDRELASQRLFWERWRDWFERRETRAPDGGVRVVYVTQDVGVGGGHRVVFEHVNGLAARGHHPEVWTLADGPPDWFDLRVPLRTFRDYPSLLDALAEVDAIKVATWWETAPTVWEASLRRGVGVYFVQDVETWYYADMPSVHGPVLATYRPEFVYLTTSSWVHDEVTKLVTDAKAIPPGVDLDTFRDLELPRAERAILAVGRANPLKNFALTRAAYAAMREPRAELWLFGVEPEVAEGMGDGVRYHVFPSDEGVRRLLSTCTVFLQTSRHEGFCLPILEAMACGTPVVCTDADGNRDFCVDGENCLIPADTPTAVRDALERVLGDAVLRARLIENGKRTAAAYGWPQRLDELAVWFEGLAERHAGTGAAAAR